MHTNDLLWLCFCLHICHLFNSWLSHDWYIVILPCISTTSYFGIRLVLQTSTIRTSCLWVLQCYRRFIEINYAINTTFQWHSRSATLSKIKYQIKYFDFVGIWIINSNILSPLCSSEKTCSSVNLNECVWMFMDANMSFIYKSIIKFDLAKTKTIPINCQ